MNHHKGIGLRNSAHGSQVLNIYLVLEDMLAGGSRTVDILAPHQEEVPDHGFFFALQLRTCSLKHMRSEHEGIDE